MKRIIKKALAIMLVATLVLGMGTTSVAKSKLSQKTKSKLRTSYENVMEYADRRGIDLGLTYKTYVKNYKGGSIKTYEKSYYKALGGSSTNEIRKQTLDSSSGSDYYYDTGTTCPSDATYGEYSLISNVQKGDIVYEAKGGFGITGHIAIVEGIYTCNSRQYIRVIEAISSGVKRGILDDTRVDDKGVKVLRVKSASTAQKKAAVAFCVGELGSSYNLDFAKDTSASETDWYCSELVWAAYKKQGINIETTGWLNEPGITPRDIYRSNKVSKISIN